MASSQRVVPLNKKIKACLGGMKCKFLFMQEKKIERARIQTIFVMAEEKDN